MLEGILLLGLITIIGFIAFYIQENYKISYILPLILLGIIIGPLFNIINVNENSIIRQLYPFMASLALILLLFDGGISLNVMNVLKNLDKHLIFSIIVFLSSVIAVPLFMFYFSFGFYPSLILAFTLAGTSSAVVLNLIKGSNASDNTQALLTIESVLSDSLVIITVVFILNFILSGVVDVGGTIRNFLSTIVLSILIGGFLAYIWVRVLDKIETYQFDYTLTLSFLFVLYAFIEYIKLSGALAIFTFGLVLGNLRKVNNAILHIPVSLKDEKIKEIQYEIGFFVKTFFFVYMGLLYPLNSFTLPMISFSMLFTAFVILTRYVIAKFMFHPLSYDISYIISSIPRGLSAAVVIGILNEMHLPFNFNNASAIVLTIIIFTNLASTILVSYFNRKAME